MASLLNPEGMPCAEFLSAEQPPANIVDLQEFREETLETPAASEQPQTLSETGEPVHVFFADWQKVEIARRDANAFETLVEEYKGFIRFKANEYFIAGGDYDDLFQEALIGFYGAVRNYDGVNSSFRSFAELCITRQLITAIKAATRLKHEALNHYISFAHTPSGQNGEEGGMTVGDMIPDSAPPAEEVIASSEGLRNIVEVLLSDLSYIEYSALKMYLEGETYETIAEELGENTKAIDNALQRVKRKLHDNLGVE